jgi:hypothetical protein
MNILQKIENFECGLVNEQEKLTHKLLEEKFFVIIFQILSIVNNKTIEYFNFIKG